MARHLAQHLARHLARHLAALGDAEHILLIPVPLHRWRRWSRGFNQAALVADELAQLTGATRDDVHASRATLRAAARVLGRGGAAWVSALTRAWVVPDALMTSNIFDFASLDSDMTDLVMTG